MIGVIPLLGVIFIILKLCGVIAWSWWLVLLPLYGAVLIAVVYVGVIAVCGVALLRVWSRQW